MFADNGDDDSPTEHSLVLDMHFELPQSKSLKLHKVTNTQATCMYMFFDTRVSFIYMCIYIDIDIDKYYIYVSFCRYST